MSLHQGHEDRCPLLPPNETDSFLQDWQLGVEQLESMLNLSTISSISNKIDLDQWYIKLDDIRAKVDQFSMQLPSFHLRKIREKMDQLEKRGSNLNSPSSNRLGFKFNPIPKPVLPSVEHEINCLVEKKMEQNFLKNNNIQVEDGPCLVNDAPLAHTDNGEGEEEEIKTNGNQSIIFLKKGEKNSDDSIRNLERCIIWQFKSNQALHLHQLRNCTIYSCPIDGSIFVNQCVNIIIHVTCRQLRIQETEKMKAFINCFTPPMMEKSKQIKIAPLWEFKNEKMESIFKTISCQWGKNRWDEMRDFEYLNRRSPNWEVIDVEEKEKEWEKLERDWQQMETMESK